MFDIAWSTIKARKGGFIAAFVALFCGAAVITACGVLFEAGLRSGVQAERYGAATVVVGGKQTMDIPENFDPHYAERVLIPANLTDRIRTVPGVDNVVVERSFDIAVATVDGKLIRGRDDSPVYGHGWSSAVLGPFTIAEGAQPGGANTVVLDSELAGRAGVTVGATVRVAIGSTPADYTVAGLVSPPAAGLHRQSAVFFTDDRAAQLSGRPDQATAIGVFGSGDAGDLAKRIEDSLPRENIATYTGTNVGDGEFLDVGQARGFLVVLSASFGGTALSVVIFVVASTLGLSIQSRRRELAMLRAIAATPRQIHSMIGAETLLVSVAGGALGAVPGYFVAGALRDAFASVGVLPPDFVLAFSPLPGIAALILCIISARVAGIVAAYRTAKIRPVEALSEAAVEPPALGRVRVNLGRLFILLGFGAAVVVPLAVPGQLAIVGAGSSVILLMLGTALVGPTLVRAASALSGPFLRRSRVSGYLAAANTHANSRRLSGAITPLALGMAMAAVQIFTLTTVGAVAAEQAETGVTADYVVTSSASGLSPDVADAVRALPGVEAVLPVARTQVMVKYTETGRLAAQPYPAQGITPDALDKTLDLAVREGKLSDLRGDTVALSWIAAGTAGVKVGDTVGINLGDSTEKNLRVVAVYGNGLGFGDVTLPHDQLVQHTTNRLDTALLVAAKGDLIPALNQLAAERTGVRVASRSEFTAVQQGEVQRQNYTNLIANALLLLYVMIAVVNTLVMATASRSREFAMLRLIGTSRRQVRRMVFMESWLVVGTAVVIGSVIAVPPLVGTSLAMTDTFLPHVDALAYLVIVGVTVLLGCLSIIIPARSVMRTRPIDAVDTGE
jgi:putative ABC transport system permease protein